MVRRPKDALKIFLEHSLEKAHKISLVKKLTVWELKVELESLHILKFYLSVLLLMINMSQSACEKLDSCCKICF